MPTFPPKAKPKILPPEGTHIARVVGFIFIGTVPNEFQGETKMMTKVRITWELPEEKHEFKEGDGEKPFTISEEYTLSLLDNSNLYPIIEGIEGYIPDEVRDSYDIEKLVGKESLITIKHGKSKKGAMFAKVASTAPLMKGQKAPEAFNPLRVMNYDDKWDQEYFNGLPQFIREKMETSEEFKKKFGIETVNPDDVPF